MPVALSPTSSHARAIPMIRARHPLPATREYGLRIDAALGRSYRDAFNV